MRRALAALLITAIVAVGAAPRAVAQPSPPAGEPALAAEELALQLLPYLLPADALPPGYRGVAGVGVDTPASQALKQTPPLVGDPWPAFAQL